MLVLTLACAALAADYLTPYAGGPGQGSFADVAAGRYKPHGGQPGLPQPQPHAPAPAMTPPAHPAAAMARPENAVAEAVTHFSLDVAKVSRAADPRCPDHGVDASGYLEMPVFVAGCDLEGHRQRRGVTDRRGQPPVAAAPGR